MNVRTGWIVAVLAMVALPAWANCGACGKGAKAGGGHTHAHGELGKKAPNFTLKGLDGKEHKLADFKGKVVVLEWTNHECPVVNGYHKADAMKETLAKFKGKPVAWLAIDSSHFCQDKVENIRKWALENKLEYPILLDAAGEVGHQYAAKATPHMFVIDQKGTLSYSGALDDDPMRVKDARRNYVEEAIEALLNGSTVKTVKTKPVGCPVKYKK